MARPIIIDCDPGHDDAIAILLAVASPAVELRAVTTCFGNCSLEDATRNALQILELAGASDVPVAAGASKPLRGEATLGNYVHGGTGLDGPQLPSATRREERLDAHDLLIENLENSDEPLTLVVIGPMTNVGRLLQERPDLVSSVREIIFMGGSTERGNHTPAAEFNTYADPEALDIVLRSGVQVKMVGLNLTHQALATHEVVARMNAQEHRIGRVSAEWMGFFGSSYNRVWEFEAPPVHDPCTIAALIDPDVIQWRRAFVAVELDGKWTRGATLVDLHGRYPQYKANADIAIELDADRYWDLVLSHLDVLGQRV